jgi:Ser/Thr protein kinase RdoA (MazF antagonist)
MTDQRPTTSPEGDGPGQSPGGFSDETSREDFAKKPGAGSDEQDAGASMAGRAGESVSGMSAVGSLSIDAEGRSVFAADELVIVLSHYRIGVIDTVKEFKRGSRKAPKLVIRSDRGLFLLKRRAHGRDDPFKVAFTHGIQLRLADHGFPLPRLIGTRRDNNSMVQYGGSVYELFEFIRGGGYDRSLEATGNAGQTLGRFHALLADYKPHYKSSKGTYHAAPMVLSSIQKLPEALTRLSNGLAVAEETEAHQLADTLDRAYREAADGVDALGLRDWPRQIGHSDWHPGNMLFDGPKIVSVIDYDTARLMQRVIDVGNGALQFSLQGRGDDTEAWPEPVDEARYRAFFAGYAAVEGGRLTQAERQTVPWLMVQALIAESVIPVAATGRFAEMDGAAFLRMVLRKVQWIKKHHEELTGWADV